MIDVYKPGTSVHQSVDKTAEILGGSIPVYVVFPAEQELDPEIANAVLRLQCQATSGGLAGQSISAYSIIRNVWENISANDGYPNSAAIAKTLADRIKLRNKDFMDNFFAMLVNCVCFECASPLSFAYFFCVFSSIASTWKVVFLFCFCCLFITFSRFSASSKAL